MYLRWLAYLPFSIAGAVIFRLIAPLVAIFYVKRYRVDVVKRFNKISVGFDREYLLPAFNWMATHDNAADEWWWGMYNVDTWFAKNWTQAQYDSSEFKRYICRLAWLWRNSGYGFSWEVLGFQRGTYTTETVTFHKDAERKTWYEKTVWTNQDGKQAFKIKGYFYITKSIYFNVNIGWKSHKEFDKLMYAGRFLSIRKD